MDVVKAILAGDADNGLAIVSADHKSRSAELCYYFNFDLLFIMMSSIIVRM